MRSGLIAAALAVAAPAAGQTLQATFDAAQAALAKGNMAAAAPLFEKVLAGMRKAASDPTNRNAALIRAQLAMALAGLARNDEAIDQYQRALPGLARPTPDDHRERAIVLDGLGRLQELSFDYDGARDRYREALALNAFGPSDPATIAIQLKLGRVTTFSDPAAARATIDAAIPAVQVIFAADKDRLGDVYSMRGRIDLNDGKPALARQWFQRALTTAGGLTTSVSLADIRIRGDLALAAYQMGDKDAARRFLAYTGAGHVESKAPGIGADMQPPACGEDGVQPADLAVVEFSVLPDGTTSGIMPIYVSRRGTELAFARAVAGWSWEPEAVKNLSVFWRRSMRLEIRCLAQSTPPSLTASLRRALLAWAPRAGVEPDGSAERSDAAELPALLAELKSRESAGPPPVTAATLYRLATNAAVTYADAASYIRRAAAIADAANAPADVRALFGLAETELAEKRSRVGSRRWQLAWANGPLAALAAKLEAEGPGSAHALAAVQVSRAAIYEQFKETSVAETYYQQAVALPNTLLPAGDDVRQFALLRLATRAASSRRFEEAMSYFTATGLTAAQCALVDVQPIKTGGALTDKDFPEEALRWGFGGWTETAYDIDSAGHVVNARTVLAYPPLIFGPTTEKAIARFRFEPLYRGGAAVGCNGRRQTVRFTIP